MVSQPNHIMLNVVIFNNDLKMSARWLESNCPIAPLPSCPLTSLPFMELSMLNVSKPKPSAIENIKPILKQLLRYLHKQFQEDLISVALYGSYARGNANVYSDLDLMVVVDGLPQEWSSIHAMEDKIALQGRTFKKRLQIQLVSPADVVYSVESAAPLMLEIYDAHYILFDRKDFFANQIQRFATIIRQRGIRKIKHGVWEVPEIASTY